MTRQRRVNDSEDPQQQDDPSAPPGAACATHPEREAHFTCPRCGSYACVFCWHPSLHRCDACLRRDPAAAAPPVPWEHGPMSGPKRYFRTLATAFSPARSAPAFARPDLRPALWFLLCSALPLSLLAGIIPHTRLLTFRAAGVEVAAGATAAALAWDIVRAMLVQLCFDGVQLGAFLLPYGTLVRSYAGPERVPYAVRVVLYRAWLHPLAALLVGVLAAIGGPAAPDADIPGWLVHASNILMVGAPVLFMMATTYVARLACGIGMALSILIVTIAALVALFSAMGTAMGLMALLPEIPAGLLSN